jgi:hypothetical protein
MRIGGLTHVCGKVARELPPMRLDHRSQKVLAPHIWNKTIDVVKPVIAVQHV